MSSCLKWARPNLAVPSFASKTKIASFCFAKRVGRSYGGRSLLQCSTEEAAECSVVQLEPKTRSQLVNHLPEVREYLFVHARQYIARQHRNASVVNPVQYSTDLRPASTLLPLDHPRLGHGAEPWQRRVAGAASLHASRTIEVLMKYVPNWIPTILILGLVAVRLFRPLPVGDAAGAPRARSYPRHHRTVELSVAPAPPRRAWAAPLHCQVTRG